VLLVAFVPAPQGMVEAMIGAAIVGAVVVIAALKAVLPDGWPGRRRAPCRAGRHRTCGQQ